MADLKQKLAAASAALTITLNSLGSGSGRCSTAIDNSSNLYNTADVTVTIVTNASGTDTTNGRVEVWLVQSEDGTNYDDGFGGSDASYTPVNATFLGTMTCNANSTTYRATFQTERTGSQLSRKWAIAIVNRTGAALHTSGNGVTYTAKLMQSV